LKIRQNSLTLNTWAKNAPIAQANEFIHVFYFQRITSTWWAVAYLQKFGTFMVEFIDTMAVQSMAQF